MIERALFIGLGGIGQRHLRNLRALLGPDLQIDAYRVRGERTLLDDRLRVIAGGDVIDEHRVNVFHDWDAVWARRPQLVFVTNPSSLHVAAAKAALVAGADVLVEKPLSHDLEGVDELIELAERTGRVTLVAYQLRYHPGFIRLAELTRGGEFGQLHSCSAEVGEYLPGFHPYEDYRRMYASRRDLGGGVTLSQIHEIDLLVALFGRPRRVFSMGGRVSSLEIDVEDLALSVLEFDQAGHRFFASLHQDYLQRPKSRFLRVRGELGSAEWSLSEARFRRWAADGSLLEEVSYADLSWNQLFLAELSAFVAAARSRQPLSPSLREGAESLRIALALLQSQTSGLPVAFDALSDAAVTSNGAATLKSADPTSNSAEVKP